jgi:NDP-sugar pyrophosphorylase family protein
MSRRAVILAGGRGTRLRPYTLVLPKPLMPIGEYPILEVIVRQLIKAGFDHITMAVNHQAKLIKAFFLDGDQWGVRIDYSQEAEPLGTMGPLRLISDLPKNFLVMNGDILSDIDYARFFDEHVEREDDFTVSSMRRDHKIDYGVLDADKSGYLIGFREKPLSSFQVSMGIYMASSRVLERIPLGKPYGFDNLMLDMLNSGRPARVRAFDGYWLDIGRPDDYMQAIDEFESMKGRFFGA